MMLLSIIMIFEIELKATEVWKKQFNAW